MPVGSGDKINICGPAGFKNLRDRSLHIILFYGMIRKLFFSVSFQQTQKKTNDFIHIFIGNNINKTFSIIFVSHILSPVLFSK